MILYYVYNIFRFKKWKLLLFIGIFCTFFLITNIIIQNLRPSIIQLVEIHKCPVCYGVSACHDIHKVNLLWHDINDDSSRLRLCPTIQHIDNLLYSIHLNYKYVDSMEYLINLWTLVSINPEPLILQILPAENGWPVPKYFGACGRIIIEEYVGLPLVDYYNKPWIQRAKIASSLLNAAYMFTFKNENFSFYLTDVSADNIAVDHKNVAKFIDLENVIVVDKNVSPEEKSNEWYALQENKMHLVCADCFAFSPKNICNHHLSDHNYYAICQLLLGLGSENPFPNGFLHDTPIDIQQQSVNIEYLLQQCAIPNSNNSRIIIGQQLKASLDMLLKKLF
ncbi:deleted in autism protein 1 homolog [Harpegnathos saltator]|uniref:deleted in autism protein 1 homolog n=1 Tax=Harpegnathos saltator TaxID=610380 RepID=UPI000DBEDE6E|nr:deleted in autism protein 1 homolog [Harpegnathos saltator]